ncbi:MAG: HEAT repeat domain-containing protein [Pseudomonadota bacterium]
MAIGAVSGNGENNSNNEARLDATEITRRLLEMSRDDDPGVHEAAAEALENREGPEITTRLLEMSRDDEFYVRAAAARALAGREGPEITRRLLEMSRDDDWGTVRAAALALANREGPEITKRLLEMSRDDDNVIVRAAAAEALANREGPEITTRLLEMSRDDDSVSARRVAALALANREGPEITRRFLEMSRDDDRGSVREAAAEALANREGPEITTRLLEMSRDDDPDVRATVALALAGKEGPEITTRLLEMSRDDKYEVREAAALALANREGEGVTTRLLEMSRDDKDEVRKAAARALAGREGPEITTRLLEMSRDDDRGRVRAAAAEALAGREGREITRRLLEMSRDDDPGVREAAAEALAGREGPEITRRLLEMSRDDDSSDVREAAAQALGPRQGEEVTARLLELLKDDKWSVYKTAAIALSTREGEEITRCLLEMSRDDKYEVRKAAAQALAQRQIADIPRQEQQEPEPQITLDLSHLHLTPRAQAALEAVATGLGLTSAQVSSDLQEMLLQARLGHPNAIESVINSLNTLLRALDTESNQTAAIELIEALGHSGSEQAIDVLISALECADPQIRYEALGALARLGGNRAQETVINYILTHTPSGTAVINIYADCLRQADHSEVLLRQLYERSQLQDADTRHSVVIILGQVGGPTAIELLTRFLADSDSEVQWQAAVLLAEAGNNSGLEILLDVVNNVDEIETIRECTLKALGELGDRRAVPILISILNDPSQIRFSIRAKAIIALGRLGDARAVPVLESLISDRDYRHFAIRALGQIGTDQVYERTVSLLRQALAAETGANSEPIEINLLCQVIAEINSNREASSRISDPELANALYIFADQPMLPGLHDNILKAIASLGDIRGIQRLIDGDSSASIMEDFVDTRHVPGLIEMVHNPGGVDSEQTRRSAIELLGHIGDQRAVSHLIRELQQRQTRRENPDVVAITYLIGALGQIGDDRAVPVILGDGADFSMRVEAVIQIGGEHARDGIIDALWDADDTSGFRQKMINYLAQFNVPEILTLADDYNLRRLVQIALLNSYLDHLGEDVPNEAARLAHEVSVSVARHRERTRGVSRAWGNGGVHNSRRPGLGWGEDIVDIRVVRADEVSDSRMIDWVATSNRQETMGASYDGTVVVRVFSEPQRLPTYVAIAPNAYVGGYQNLALTAGTFAQDTINNRDPVRVVVGNRQINPQQTRNVGGVIEAVLGNACSSSETSVLEMVQGIRAQNLSSGSRVFLVANFYQESAEDLAEVGRALAGLRARGITVVPVQMGDTANLPSTIVDFGNHHFRVPPRVEAEVQQARAEEFQAAIRAFLNDNHGVAVPINDVSSSSDLPGRIMMELLRPRSSRDYGEAPHIEIDGNRIDHSVAIVETEPPREIVELFQDALDQSVEGDLQHLADLVHTAQMMGWTFVFDLLRSEMQRVGLNLALSASIRTDAEIENIRQTIANLSLETNELSGPIFGLPQDIEAMFWGPSDSSLRKFVERRNARIAEQRNSPPRPFGPSPDSVVRDEQNITPFNSGADRPDSNHQLLMTFAHPELLVNGAEYFATSVTSARNPATLGYDVAPELSLEHFLGMGDGLTVRGWLTKYVGFDEQTTPVPLNGNVSGSTPIPLDFRSVDFSMYYIDYSVPSAPVESPVLEMTVADLREQGEEIYGEQYSVLTDAVPIHSLPQYIQNEINEVVKSVENLPVQEAISVIQRYVLSRFRYQYLNNSVERTLLDRVRQISAARQGKGQEYLAMIYGNPMRHGVCAELTEVTMTLLRMAGIPTARFSGLVAQQGRGLTSAGHAVSIVVVPRTGEPGRWQAIPVKTSYAHASEEVLADLNLRRVENEDGVRTEPVAEETEDTDEDDENIVEVPASTGSARTDIIADPGETYSPVRPELVEGQTDLDNPLNIIADDMQAWWQQASDEERVRMHSAFLLLDLVIMGSADEVGYDDNLQPINRFVQWHWRTPEGFEALVRGEARLIERGSETMHDPSWWMHQIQSYVGQQTPFPQLRTVTEQDVLGLMAQLPEIMAHTSE